MSKQKSRDDSSWEDLRVMLHSLDRCCHDVGLSISARKTKSMTMLPENHWQVPEPVHLCGSNGPMEAVSFSYLGSVLFDDCSLDAEVSVHISRAS